MGLSILSGLLLSLSFPKWDLSWAAFIGLVPLLVALRGQTPIRCFWLGWIMGLVHYMGTLFWIKNTMVNYGGMSLPGSLLVLLLLDSYLALYPAVFGFLLGYGGRPSGRPPLLAAPFLFTALELVREYALSGFPWAGLSHSQFANLHLIQIADVTGAYGVTFLIVLTNTALAEILLSGNPFRRDPGEPSPWPMAGAALLLLGLVWLYGDRQIGRYTEAEAEGDRLAIGIAQGNIDQSIKWEPKSRELIFQGYVRQSEKAAKAGVDLVVWPETAAPFFYGLDKPYSARLRAFAREKNVTVAFGSPGVDFKDDRTLGYNRAFVVTPEGDAGHYDKIHLVPFGEYIPLKKLLFFVEAMASGIGEMEGGKTFPLFSVKGHEFGFQICFEIIFSGLSRKFVDGGADFLVNITNDAWFGKSAASYQHLSMIPFRAVENRVPIVRSANTGISAIIDPVGRIRRETALFVRTDLIGDISLPQRVIPETGDSPPRKGNHSSLSGPHRNKTFFTRFGNVFGFFCVLCSSIWFWMEFRRRRSLPAQ